MRLIHWKSMPGWWGFALYWHPDRNPILAFSKVPKAWAWIVGGWNHIKLRED